MGISISFILLFSVLGYIDRYVGNRLEPGYTVMDTDGGEKYRWGSIFIFILVAIGILMLVDKNLDVLKWFFILMMSIYWGFQSFMEWKFVEGNKYRLSLLLLIVGAVATWGIFFIDKKVTETTFGTELDELLNDEEISRIEILWTEQDESGKYSWKQATIIDQKMIEKFSNMSSEMKLKKSSSTIPGIDYNVTIHTTIGQHQLTFSEVDLRLGRNKYLILDENDLINLIKRENLKWEPFF